MNIFILLYFLSVYFIIINAKTIEITKDIEEDDETFYTGTIIKYLNITDIPSGNENDDDNDVFISATTQKTFNETFYNQLNNGEQVLFNYFYDICIQPKPQLSSKETIDTFIDKNKISVDRVMTSLVYDNPQFWWIEKYSISLKTIYRPVDENNYIKVTQITYNFVNEKSIFKDLTSEDIYNMNLEIQFEVDLFLYQVELLNIHSKYKLIKFIHDYIIRNTVYEIEGEAYIHSIYGPLVKHKGVCSGYSETFKYLASFYGINIIIGRSITHEWNYAYINNKWYMIDTTWDDPSVYKENQSSSSSSSSSSPLSSSSSKTNDGYFYRPAKGDHSNLSYDYFLIGTKKHERDSDFLNDHNLIYSYFTTNSVVNYPYIETKDYVYSDDIDEYVERIQEINDKNSNANYSLMNHKSFLNYILFYLIINSFISFLVY